MALISAVSPMLECNAWPQAGGVTTQSLSGGWDEGQGLGAWFSVMENINSCTSRPDAMRLNLLGTADAGYLTLPGLLCSARLQPPPARK